MSSQKINTALADGGGSTKGGLACVVLQLPDGVLGQTAGEQRCTVGVPLEDQG